MSIGARDDDNSTPLHIAAYNDDLDTVKYLVEQGAALGWSGGSSSLSGISALPRLPSSSIADAYKQRKVEKGMK